MAYQQVFEAFDTAQTYASNARDQAAEFLDALNTTVAGLTPPVIEDTIEPPESPNLTLVLPELGSSSIEFTETVAPTDIEDAPVISQTSYGAPSAPDMVGITFEPVAVAKPEQPAALVTPTLPDAPDLPDVALPVPLDIRTITFGGIDDHGEWLERLETIPELTLAEPTAYAYSPSPAYTSVLLSELTALVRTRLQTSTGLPADVEQALWDRARDREAQAAQANYDEVMRNAEARGFSLPTGAMHAQLREAQRTMHAKTSELSRDIAIKQAELEQSNARHAMEQGLALESRLIEYANNMEQRAFESARYLAQNAIEIHNALVTKFRVVLDGYNTYASIYRTLIDAEKSKVDVYRAEIDAERAKVEINNSRVAQYKAEIEGRMALVELYRAELSAAQTQVELEKLKIEAYGERVKAYVAELNGEATKAEMYKVMQQGNAVLVDAYKAEVDAFGTKVNAEATRARTEAEVYSARVNAYQARVQAYQARVQAESERVRALTSVRDQDVQYAKFQLDAGLAEKQLASEQYRSNISLYEASKSIVFQKSKLMSDNYMAIKNLVADAAKVAAQVNAQMAASAYGTIQANASIQGSDSINTSFSYAGKTSDTRSAPTYVP